MAIKDSGPLSDFDRLTLHQAVTIVALELLRARVAGDTERRLAGDVLDAVVRGELGGADLARRLAPFGLSDRVAAMVIQRPHSGRGSPGPDRVCADRGAARRRGRRAGGVDRTADVRAGPGDGRRGAVRAGLSRRRPGRRRSWELGRRRVGVGRAVSGGDARRSFHEARCAVEALALGMTANGDNGSGDHASAGAPRIATYKDLGSFQLLLSLQDDEALRLFCDSILGPIEASEGHYGGELMRSLEAFIEENGQWERAARRLYCHRHTLRYRIRRVEELTGRNLGSARDRIEFWLALRGRELVT